jgi:hypothetical protein
MALAAPPEANGVLAAVANLFVLFVGAKLGEEV